jgi:hypothetical protein
VIQTRKRGLGMCCSPSNSRAWKAFIHFSVSSCLTLSTSYPLTFPDKGFLQGMASREHTDSYHTKG